MGRHAASKVACPKKFLSVMKDLRNTRLDTPCAQIAPDHARDRVLQTDIGVNTGGRRGLRGVKLVIRLPAAAS